MQVVFAHHLESAYQLGSTSKEELSLVSERNAFVCQQGRRLFAQEQNVIGCLMGEDLRLGLQIVLERTMTVQVSGTEVRYNCNVRTPSQ